MRARKPQAGAHPGGDSSEDEVGEPMLHPEHAAHHEGGGERERDEAQPLGGRGVVRVRIGGGNDDEADRVVGDGEEQKELNPRVMQREDLGMNGVGSCRRSAGQSSARDRSG